jgi:TonB family protein
MPGILLSMLASSVVAATPATPQPWFEFKDYPMQAFEKKMEGVTQFELLIAKDGTVADCSVTRSSGFSILDERTCFLATKRAKFRPARGPNGELEYGVYRSQAVWVFPERQMLGANPGPDLEVSLNQLPAGTIDPPVVKLAYAVDAQGNASSCSLMRSAPAQPQVLVDVGCKELLENVSHAPVRTPAGQPVPVVKTAAVKFKAGPQ